MGFDIFHEKAYKDNPACFAITAAEANTIDKIDDIIDSVTQKYKTVTADGVKIIVSGETITAIEATLQAQGIEPQAAAKLADDILTGRQWYTLLAIVDDETGKLANEALLLLCNNERRVIPWDMANESNIPKHREILRLNTELKFIPAIYYDTLRQILYLFDKREQQPQGGYALPSFRTITQGAATNALTKVYTARRKMPIDEFTGRATIEKGDLIISIADYSKQPIKLKASTYRLLDAITARFTETGGKTASVEFSLSEYMQICGLSDVKGTREQVKEDLTALYSLSLSFQGKGKRNLNFMDIRLCGAKGIVNGIIKFSFSEPFYNILKQYPVMALPAGYFKLNAKRNPNSPAFLRKLAELKNMNVAKSNADIVSVRTLLECTESLPTYEEIKHAGRRVRQQIIDPFERDLDALDNTLTWEYCHRNGEPLTDGELDNMSYQVFAELLIKIYWKEYPTRPLERAKERAAESKPIKKKRGRPRKAAE